MGTKCRRTNLPMVEISATKKQRKCDQSALLTQRYVITSSKRWLLSHLLGKLTFRNFLILNAMKTIQATLSRNDVEVTSAPGKGTGSHRLIIIFVHSVVVFAIRQSLILQLYCYRGCERNTCNWKPTWIQSGFSNGLSVLIDFFITLLWDSPMGCHMRRVQQRK